MSGGSTGTQNIPVNEVDEYDSLGFTSANNNQRVFNLDSETQSVVIVAKPSNSGVIYIGFNDQVTTDNGLPLKAGGSTVLPLDVSQVDVFAVADTGGDEIRFAALG